MAERSLKLPLFVFGLTLSSLTLAAVLRDQLQANPSARTTVPTPSSSVEVVGGWRGPADLAAKGLELIFAPLHTDPKRQSYDAKMLAERLGLDAGAPFRLEVKASHMAETAALLEAARLGAVSIVDASGEAARLLPALVQNPAPGALPILRLFAPDATLDADAGGRLIFWGRAPGSGAKLVATGATWKLSASAVPRGDLPLFVASLNSDLAPRSL